MRLTLEYKKMKRTGLVQAILGGGVLAALVPVLNMAVRWENYINIPQNPIQILLGANWQMMAMLNLLMIVVGSCMMYHVEYADHAIQKMQSLPGKEEMLFFGKFAVLSGMCILALVIEVVSLGGCAVHWFPETDRMYVEILKNLLYAILLILPVILTSLLISSICKNMWTSLGIGVICTAAATMFPTRYFVFIIFPFALPFQYLIGTDTGRVIGIVTAAVVEILLCVLIEIYLKTRRV